MKAFLDRPIEGDWPYLWIDATYVKARDNGRIVSAAVIVAVGVNSDGQRKVLGMDIGPSEAETFWTEFLRMLRRRGLRGVKLVVSDAHEGIKAAVAKIMHASWQRCRVHFLRNALAHAGKSGRRVVSAFIATAFAQDDAPSASAQWRKVADQLRKHQGAHLQGQIQALDRTQPGLPLKPGKCGTMTHDYKRIGATSLFAALNLLDEAVIRR